MGDAAWQRNLINSRGLSTNAVKGSECFQVKPLALHLPSVPAAAMQRSALLMGTGGLSESPLLKALRDEASLGKGNPWNLRQK